MSDNNNHQKESPPWQVLLNILRGRRSRRFGLGMEMESGPMAYKSRKPGLPLTENEEALPIIWQPGTVDPSQNLWGNQWCELPTRQHWPCKGNSIVYIRRTTLSI